VATFWVTEFLAVQAGAAPAAQFPSIQTQAVTVGLGAMNLTLSGSTYLVRIFSDTTCYVDIGVAPNPTMPLPAEQPEYFIVTPGFQVGVKQR
jgi:hypothetical protein